MAQRGKTARAAASLSHPLARAGSPSARAKFVRSGVDSNRSVHIAVESGGNLADEIDWPAGRSPGYPDAARRSLTLRVPPGCPRVESGQSEEERWDSR